MIRFYIVPMVGSGANRADARRPKYFTDAEAKPVTRYQMRGFGLGWCLVRAPEITQIQHDQLTAQSDVYAFPEDLSQGIGQAAKDAVKAKLNAVGAPYNWVDSVSTWRGIVRGIAKLFVIVSMIRNRKPNRWRTFLDSVDWSAEFQSLPQAAQNRLNQIAQAVADVEEIPPTMTLEGLLIRFAQRLPNMYMGGEDL